MEVKRIPIDEFRRYGFLQEANRQFFHPLGLALEIAVDPETGEEKLGGIWDYRGDPEGIIFAEDTIDSQKTKRVLRMQKRKAKLRKALLGYVYQSY